MKNYIRPELDVNEIVALEYINSQKDYDNWVQEENLDGVTVFNMKSLF